jgi:hypothetical protein
MRSLRSEIGILRPRVQNQRFKVQFLHVVALPGRMRLVDPAVDALCMDAPSRRHGIAESFDGHENN